MSYIAFDLDALSSAPKAARAAGVAEDTIIAGLLRVWEHAWRRKTDLLNELEVRGCFNAQVDVLPALTAFGFIAQADGGLHIKGADRYLRVSEARSKGGKAASGNLRRGRAQPVNQPVTATGALPAVAGEQPDSTPGCFPGLTANSEQRTANIEHREEDPPPRNLPTPPKRKLLIVDAADPEPLEAPQHVDRGPLVYQPPETPSHQWTPEEFFRWAQHTRAGIGLVGERWPRRNLSHWWSEVQSTPGMEAHRAGVDRLRAGFLAFARDEHWAQAKPPAPFSAFMATWRNFVPPEIPGLTAGGAA